MLDYMMIKKDGQIFVDASCADYQQVVIRRAARVSLREDSQVNYRVINREKYITLTVAEAMKIMTPKRWGEELMDPLSDPLRKKEKSNLTKKVKDRIVAELKKQRDELHNECIAFEKEIRKVTDQLGL
jgi:hypothetical protein